MGTSARCEGSASVPPSPGSSSRGTSVLFLPFPSLPVHGSQVLGAAMGPGPCCRCWGGPVPPRLDAAGPLVPPGLGHRGGWLSRLSWLGAPHTRGPGAVGWAGSRVQSAELGVEAGPVARALPACAAPARSPFLFPGPAPALLPLAGSGVSCGAVPRPQHPAPFAARNLLGPARGWQCLVGQSHWVWWCHRLWHTTGELRPRGPAH